MPTTITGNPATSHGDPISFTAPADGETANAASVESPYQALADVIAELQADVVKKAGTQTITGNKTFSGANDFSTGSVAVAVAASAAQPVRKDTFDAATAAHTAISSDVSMSTSSTSYVDFTGLTATITARGGRPIGIFLGAGAVAGGPTLFTGGAGVGGNATNFRIVKDGTPITSDLVLTSGVDTFEFPFLGFLKSDSPTAGSHTYKIQWKVNAASSALSNVNLLLVEF